MKQQLRFCIGVVVSLALVGFAIAMLVDEIRFGREAVATTATVEQYTGRRLLIGRGGGSAFHEVGGQPVKAMFRSWYVYRRPGEGERLSVLYRPIEPDRVVIDSFMQRFGPLAFPLILALAVASWAGIFRRRCEVSIPRPPSELGKDTTDSR